MVAEIGKPQPLGRPYYTRSDRLCRRQKMETQGEVFHFLIFIIINSICTTTIVYSFHYHYHCNALFIFQSMRAHLVREKLYRYSHLSRGNDESLPLINRHPKLKHTKPISHRKRIRRVEGGESYHSLILTQQTQVRTGNSPSGGGGPRTHIQLTPQELRRAPQRNNSRVTNPHRKTRSHRAAKLALYYYVTAKGNWDANICGALTVICHHHHIVIGPL